MNYPLLKTLHLSCAAISYTLFVLRGLWMLNESRLRQQRWVKIMPHIVDTVLLGSAIALTFTLRQYPFANGWLTAKFFALLLYIGLGSVALKYGKTLLIRRTSWLGAQIVFGYIVLVAINHNPLIL